MSIFTIKCRGCCFKLLRAHCCSYHDLAPGGSLISPDGQRCPEESRSGFFSQGPPRRAPGLERETPALHPLLLWSLPAERSRRLRHSLSRVRRVRRSFCFPRCGTCNKNTAKTAPELDTKIPCLLKSPWKKPLFLFLFSFSFWTCYANAAISASSAPLRLTGLTNKGRA